MILDTLSSLITGRTSDLFATDMYARQKELSERIKGSRILIIGGAGSIGSATVHALSAFCPQALHVVDQNENSLAELVRDVRSSTVDFPISDFRTLPLDFGSPIMQRFLTDAEPYDFVLNFAANKHVRSEKDVYSLLQLLNTNLVKTAHFLEWLAKNNIVRRFFCVSTDKAANPVNLMGASKRIMEHLLFSGEVVSTQNIEVTSARFANVAFSDGSLLDSFLQRIKKRQPLAVPRNTQRYFVSLREAGQICLLAAVCAPHGLILIPQLDPSNDLQDLQTIAVKVLKYYGFEPHFHQNEAEAKASLESDIKRGYYPVLLTPLDTSGEKPYEEFVGEGEKAIDIGMYNLLGVQYLPAQQGIICSLLMKIENSISQVNTPTTKEEIVLLLSSVLPQMRHIETGKNLDEHM